MTTKKSISLRIAIILFYILSAGTIAFGSLYFFRSDIMPYHYSFLNLTPTELTNFNPNILKLMIAFLKIIGSSFIAIGIGIAIITFRGIRQEKAWAWWSIFVIYFFPIVTTYIITLIVSNNIIEGPKPPSWLALSMIIDLFLALILSVRILKCNEIAKK